MVLKTLKNQITGTKDKGDECEIDPFEEMYEIISHDETLGIVTKVVIFEEPQFTFLDIDNDVGGPVFL